MELKMEVYSPALELLGLLEVHNAVIWERRAFAAGSFSVSSLLTGEAIRLLQPENIIWIAGEDAGIIEYVRQEAGEDGPLLSVKGCDLTGLLERRILWGQYDLSGTPAGIMYRLVEDCAVNPTRGDAQARRIPGLVLSDLPAGGTSIRARKTGGTLLEALEELGKTYQTAFGVRFDPAVPQMVFWARPGVDRGIHQTANDPVFYSTELDDVLDSEYAYNSQDYRNIALVAGEGEGKDRVYVTVGGSGGDTPEPPVKPSRLPDGYTELEYIRSSGTQFMDLGFPPSTTLRLDIDVNVTTLPQGNGSYFCFFGCYERVAGGYVQFRVTVRNNSGVTILGFVYGSGYFDANNHLTAGRHRICFDAANRQASCDDETISLTGAASPAFTKNLNLLLFASNNAGRADDFCSVDLHSCQAYNQNVLIRDLVPCKDPSGTVGLYDLVNNAFYGNNGTGEFAAGPAV